MQLSQTFAPSVSAGKRTHSARPFATAPAVATRALKQLTAYQMCSGVTTDACAAGPSTSHVRRRLVVRSAAANSTATASLPELLPLNDDFERNHGFGDFANWLIPGYVMVGRYPYVEPSRCKSYELGESQLEKIIESGVTTFVSLQEEVPAQEKMTLAGKNGFLPYKSTAELIKSSFAPPPSMEVMMNLRNPTLDKFLPAKKRKPVVHDDTPSYALEFLYYPVVDLQCPDAATLKPFIDTLLERVTKGEKLYVHCWGGRGRAGTVGACMLIQGYGLSADEALERVQRAFSTRQDTKERSPETDEQHAFVRSYAKALGR